MDAAGGMEENEIHFLFFFKESSSSSPSYLCEAIIIW